MSNASPATSYRIRTATADDIPAIETVVNQAFVVEDFLEGVRTCAAQIADSLQTGQILVLENDTQILGSIYLEFRADHGYMGMLAVDPARQGEGLSKLLFRAAEDAFRAAGLTEIEIIVLNLRPELLGIYERAGFRQTGTEEFHYRVFKEGQSGHSIVMRKKIS